MGFKVTTERLRGRELKCENMLTFGEYLFTTFASKLSAMPLLLKARLEIYSSGSTASYVSEIVFRLIFIQFIITVWCFRLILHVGSYY